LIDIIFAGHVIGNFFGTGEAGLFAAATPRGQSGTQKILRNEYFFEPIVQTISLSSYEGYLGFGSECDDLAFL
jgi:hypothetical protein